MSPGRYRHHSPLGPTRGGRPPPRQCHPPTNNARHNAPRPHPQSECAGRGGRGGRGGHGDHDGRPTPRPPTDLGSLFVSATCHASLLPTNTTRIYYPDWMYMGKSCGGAFGECSGWHGNFDRLNHAGDKRLIADHVTATPGLWFNVDNVRTLTDPTHIAQLAGPNRPPGAN